MEIKNYKIQANNRIYNFNIICETWETSQAWGHKVTLFENCHEIITNKCRYYNRTGERYTYQSCILGAISKELEAIEEVYKKDIKRSKNGKRVTKKRADYITQEYQKNELWQAYNKLYKKCA